ncbi:Protein FecR [Methylophilaceae bacterium]|nr:Protein FecR [Methylophilaceae bacterium]
MSDPIKVASEWYVRINEPDASDEDRRAFACWKAASPANADAWERIRKVNEPFEGLEPAISKAVLLQHESTSLSRRRVLKKLGIVVVLSSSGLLAYRQQPWQAVLADYSTGKGENRTLALPDATELVLNTGTAIDTRYSESSRTVVLLKGEILVETGHGSGISAPFKVQTRHGTVTALGTRFSVRDHGDHISVNVFKDSVLIKSSNHQEERIISADWSASFSKDTAPETTPLLPGSDLWAKGILSVNDMPLKQFLLELGRYHDGFLRCDQAIENIPVSGSFPVNDINEILSSLKNTHPVRIETVTRYWITLKPA